MTRVSMTQAHLHTCRCGATIDASSKFCAFCGRPIAAETCATLVAPAPTLLRAPSVVATKTMVAPVLSRVRPTIGTSPASDLHARSRMTAQGECSEREDLVLVLDCSPSMGELFGVGQTKLEAAQNAACQMVCVRRKTAPSDRVGIVRFWSGSQVVIPLTPVGTGGRDLVRGIQSIGYDDGTDLAAGLAMAYDLFDWHAIGIVRRVVLLTDGMGGDPIPVADRLKAKNVIIETIGVAAGQSADQLDEPLLRRVASTVDGQLKYVFIRDHATLLATFTNIATRVAPLTHRAALATF